MAKTPYFCLSQQKKRTALKEPVKKNVNSGHVKRLKCCLNFVEK